MLQMRVVICFLILVCGRVINVYVPIYYRNIVNALTPTSIPGGNHTHSLDTALGLSLAATGVTFPLASILIYVLLKFLQVCSACQATHSLTSSPCRAALWEVLGSLITCAVSYGSKFSSIPVEHCEWIYFSIFTTCPCAGIWAARLVCY